MNPRVRFATFIGLLGLLSGCQSAAVSSAYATSEYLHSNDTFKLMLSTNGRNSLRGPPGSEHSLEFILLNNAKNGHFTITAHSDDAFMGVLSAREAYLETGTQQRILVSKMFVPKKKEGEIVRFTLTAVRDSGYAKREAPPGGSGSYPGGSNPGGSGSYPGGSGSYPGGSGSYPGGSNPGGSGSYPGGSNPGGSGSYPGGSNPGGSGSYPGGSGSYPGGSGSYPGGSGSYPGGSGNYPGGSGSYPGGSGNNPGGSGSYPGGSGGYPGGSGSYPGASGSYPGGSGSYPGGSGNYPGGSGGYPDEDHASVRRKVSITVEFIVTQENEDEDDRPWTKMEYDAETQQQTCRAKPGQPGCENYFWGIKVQVQDQGSGLSEVEVNPVGSAPFSRSIYYRHLNFPVGTTQIYEVTAVASCCTQGMTFRARDVNNNEALIEAVYDGVGSNGLSPTALWGIIGGIAALVIIVVVVVLVVVCRKKYSAVPNS